MKRKNFSKKKGKNSTFKDIIYGLKMLYECGDKLVITRIISVLSFWFFTGFVEDILLLKYLLQALENGALLVVDEIEDSLHPLLTKRFIEMVQDRNVNTNGAQLLFTTHDAMLLDLSFLRRDQIWFAEKNDKSCATELYSLASFSPRKGENVRKGYLQGRFGTIPFIGGDTQWQN